MTFRDWVDLSPLDRLRPAAPLAVRAFLCVYLLYMSQDNLLSGAGGPTDRTLAPTEARCHT